MDTQTPLVGHSHRVIARAAAVIGLVGVALIHLLDLQSKFHETPYLGVGYLLLIAGCLACAAALVHRDSKAAWYVAAALCVGSVAAFAISRSVGLPSASDDIGNWLEPLGLAAMFVELITGAVCGYALLHTGGSAVSGEANLGVDPAGIRRPKGDRAAVGAS